MSAPMVLDFRFWSIITDAIIQIIEKLNRVHFTWVILIDTREDHTKILRIWSVQLFWSLCKTTAHF